MSKLSLIDCIVEADQKATIRAKVRIRVVEARAEL